MWAAVGWQRPKPVTAEGGGQQLLGHQLLMIRSSGCWQLRGVLWSRQQSLQTFNGGVANHHWLRLTCFCSMLTHRVGIYGIMCVLLERVKKV